MTPPSLAGHDDRGRWLALAVCLAGGFIVFLDVSIVNVALPTISVHLHTSGSGLQWIVSGYALAFGLLLVPSGRVGDIHGHRMLFVAGLAAFVAASAVCGAAPSAAVLVFGRIVQGAAGGVLTPQVSATIQQLFQGAARGRAFGYFASVAAVASAIGPLAGGALIAAFGTADGWRAVFYVNVPIGLVLCPFAVMLLPRHVRPAGRRPGLDRVGVGLLGLGVVLILLPFIENGWGTWRWSLLAAAAVALALFVWWERRVTDPVLDLRLFGDRSYTTGVSVITLYFAAFTPLFFVFTLLLQLGLGYSALAAGAAITPFAVGSALSAALSGQYAVRHGRALIAAGLLLMLAGFAGSAAAVELVPHHGTALATLAPILVAGIAGGLVIAPNQSLALAGVPLPQAGAAGGLLQTGQRIGASIGIAVAGAAFFSTLRGHGTFPQAYRSGIAVISAITAMALLLALIDWRQARHASDDNARPGWEAPDDPNVPARDIPDRR
jgi:EmrB/QacA subfamily drug resistance transporter